MHGLHRTPNGIPPRMTSEILGPYASHPEEAARNAWSGVHERDIITTLSFTLSLAHS